MNRTRRNRHKRRVKMRRINAKINALICGLYPAWQDHCAVTIPNLPPSGQRYTIDLTDHEVLVYSSGRVEVWEFGRLQRLDLGVRIYPEMSP